MQPQEIEFLQQFHTENIDLPSEDRHFGNVYFRHYSRGRKERASLEEVVEDQLDHSAIIDSLIAGMEREDRAADRQLATALQKMHSALLSLIRREPGASDRLQRLADEVAEFSGTVRIHEMRAQPALLDALKNISAERKAARTSRYIGSGYVRTIQTAVRKYRDAMDLFYNLFIRLLEQESVRNGRAGLMTPVAGDLAGLTGLIRNRIVLIEQRFNLLGEWKMRMRLAEKQGLYN
ncbi:MAG TPA: hypothetical protein VGR89_02465 [Puia sp.]|nr:hypothetical protein [Puia sp.]